jgi:hypothetical protein
VLSDWSGDSRDLSRSVLLAKAYERSRAIFISTFADIIDGDDARHGQVRPASLLRLHDH